MPPLTRQRTPESILSWWSDSNLPGPTLNLHAITKPLMKGMYHRSALNFLKRNTGLPLCQEMMEICCSYLSSKYVSSVTKTAILKDLTQRARSGKDVAAMVHSNLADNVLPLAQSSTLGQCASAFLEINQGVALSPQLMEMCWIYASSQDSPSLSRTLIVNDLAARARSGQGTEAMVQPDNLHKILQLVQSPDKEIRTTAGFILSHLARHSKSAAVAISVPLVSLLNDTDILLEYGILALISFTRVHSNGAEAAVEAGLLPRAIQLLESPIPTVRCGSCKILGNLGRNKSTAAAVSNTRACETLVNTLSDSDAGEDAFAALSNTATWPDGAAAVVASKALTYVAERLASKKTEARRSTCILLEKLAQYECAVSAILGIKICERLVNLMRHVAEDAFDALCNIADWPDGAEAIVEANVLGHVVTRLQSSGERIQLSTQKMVERLWRNESSAAAARALGVRRERAMAAYTD